MDKKVIRCWHAEAGGQCLRVPIDISDKCPSEIHIGPVLLKMLIKDIDEGIEHTLSKCRWHWADWWSWKPRAQTQLSWAAAIRSWLTNLIFYDWMTCLVDEEQLWMLPVWTSAKPLKLASASYSSKSWQPPTWTGPFFTGLRTGWIARPESGSEWCWWMVIWHLVTGEKHFFLEKKDVLLCSCP